MPAPPGLASLLAHELEPSLLALETRLRDCLEEVAALRAVVRDLDLLEKGQVTVQRFPILPVLDAVRRRFDPIARSRGIALEIASDAGGIEIEGDPRATERVLSNLVDNAMKFSPGGKGIRVSLRQTEGMIRIEVEDDGVGIPPGDQERIFEPFVRLDRERPGSGLGLAIAWALAEAQGGRLTVESTPGRGSRFALVLRPA